MHDRNGNELKKGDVVLVPCVVKDLFATDEYCNVTLESVLGRRPDDMKETIYAINTGVTLRANEGDNVLIQLASAGTWSKK